MSSFRVNANSAFANNALDAVTFALFMMSLLKSVSRRDFFFTRNQNRGFSRT
jgi:hypothetical protein